MNKPSIFCVKLQLHFGGDIHEISVPSFGGAEPTVSDLMTVIERDFRVPRVLQNITFHGQVLHPLSNEPLSCFGIRNGVAVRLVGRMTPPDMVQQINNQYNTNSYQQSCYTQQPNINTTCYTSEQCPPDCSERFQYPRNVSVGVQYEPLPSATCPDQNQPPPTPKQGQ